jgi:hypothetical protein
VTLAFSKFDPPGPTAPYFGFHCPDCGSTKCAPVGDGTAYCYDCCTKFAAEVLIGGSSAAAPTPVLPDSEVGATVPSAIPLEDGAPVSPFAPERVSYPPSLNARRAVPRHARKRGAGFLSRVLSRFGPPFLPKGLGLGSTFKIG